MPDDTTDDVFDATPDGDATDTGTLTDAEQTLQQNEQAEAQAAATGDYATANNDAQQAYSANAKVMQTADQMIQALLQVIQ